MKLFGPKKLAAFTPTNRLEESLERIKGHPERLPDFIRFIFHFDLLAMGEVVKADEGKGSAQTFAFQTVKGAEAPVIMAFTSEQALSYYLGKSRLPAQNYVGMKADELLRIASDGFEIILNPGHETPLYFKNSDIKAILNGPEFTTEMVEAEEAVMIGKPTDVPGNLIKLLRDYKSEHQKLQNFYFGLMQRGEADAEYLGIMDFGDRNVSAADRQRFQNDIYQLTCSSYGEAIDMQFLVAQDQTQIQNLLKNDALYKI